MGELENSSIIGRLLEEISWEGNARRYRDGGRGRENVLRAEVLLALCFLPRSTFLAGVLRSATGATEAREIVARDLESAEVSVLPGDWSLPGAQRHVQPDAAISGPGFLVLVEAKRIRPSRFQGEQLAREYVSLLHQAGDRTPLLFLILGSPPPISVAGANAKLNIADAITRRLDLVLDNTLDDIFDRNTLIHQLHDVVAWTTWAAIGELLTEFRHSFDTLGEGVAGTVRRLCDSAIRAIRWHS